MQTDWELVLFFHQRHTRIFAALGKKILPTSLVAYLRPGKGGIRALEWWLSSLLVCFCTCSDFAIGTNLFFPGRRGWLRWWTFGKFYAFLVKALFSRGPGLLAPTYSVPLPEAAPSKYVQGMCTPFLLSLSICYSLLCCLAGYADLALLPMQPHSFLLAVTKETLSHTALLMKHILHEERVLPRNTIPSFPQTDEYQKHLLLSWLIETVIS